jgi:Fe-S metabolism associated domain
MSVWLQTIGVRRLARARSLATRRGHVDKPLPGPPAPLKSASTMNAQTDTAFEDLRAEFDLLGDWEERYRYVIDLGRTLEPLSQDEH